MSPLRLMSLLVLLLVVDTFNALPTDRSREDITAESNDNGSGISDEQIVTNKEESSGEVADESNTDEDESDMTDEEKKEETEDLEDLKESENKEKDEDREDAQNDEEKENEDDSGDEEEEKRSTTKPQVKAATPVAVAKQTSAIKGDKSAKKCGCGCCCCEPCCHCCCCEPCCHCCCEPCCDCCHHCCCCEPCCCDCCHHCCHCCHQCCGCCGCGCGCRKDEGTSGKKCDGKQSDSKTCNCKNGKECQRRCACPFPGLGYHGAFPLALPYPGYFGVPHPAMLYQHYPAIAPIYGYY